MAKSGMVACESERPPHSGQDLGIPQREEAPNANWSFCVKEKEIYGIASQPQTAEKAGFRNDSEPADKSGPDRNLIPSKKNVPSAEG